MQNKGLNIDLQVRLLGLTFFYVHMRQMFTKYKLLVFLQIRTGPG